MKKRKRKMYSASIGGASDFSDPSLRDQLIMIVVIILATSATTANTESLTATTTTTTTTVACKSFERNSTQLSLAPIAAAAAAAAGADLLQARKNASNLISSLEFTARNQTDNATDGGPSFLSGDLMALELNDRPNLELNHQQQQQHHPRPPYTLQAANSSEPPPEATAAVKTTTTTTLEAPFARPPTVVPIFFIKPHPDFRLVNSGAQSVSRFKFPIISHQPAAAAVAAATTSSNLATQSGINSDKNNDSFARNEKHLSSSSSSPVEADSSDSLTSGREFDFEKFDRQTTLLNNAEDELENKLRMANYQRINTNNNNNNNINSSGNNKNWTELLRQASESNVMESLMVTNKTMVSLLCDSNEMLLRLKFRHPFHGLIVTTGGSNSNSTPNRLALLSTTNSNCSLAGDGGQYYEWRISLHDCGTRQEMPRLFMNSIQIKFTNHRRRQQQQQPASKTQFELLAEEELKTIICSYPIRPRAPPPPDLNTNRLDRIIEQPETEPAKLIYYEPIVLISGLLLLSLTLLGLVTSAYLFTSSRRGGRRQQRATQASAGPSNVPGDFSYRRPPSRLANNFRTRNFIMPPSISLDPELVGGGGGGRKTPTRPVNKKQPSRNGRRLVVGKQYSDDLGLPSAKRGKWKESNVLNDGPFISTSSEASTDSLAAAAAAAAASTETKSAKSVTTIEIPFIKQPREQGQVDDTKLKEDSVWMKRISRRSTKSTTSHVISRTTTTRGTLTNAIGGDTSGEKTSANQIPPFGSLRAKLTSPSEYKRLQTIADMFGETLMVEQSGGGSSNNTSYDDRVMIYTLKPSKYKAKIQATLSDSEIKAVSNLLHGDELFRSLVVDSTNREIFARKLRNGTRYTNELSSETWRLLEEILLDKDLLSSQAADQKPAAAAAQSRPPVPPKPVMLIRDVGCEPAATSKQQMVEDSSPIDGVNHQPESRRPAINRRGLESRVEPKATKDSARHESTTTTTHRVAGAAGADGSSGGKKEFSISDGTGIRVSRFNTSTTRRENGGGLSGTLINIDSELNFSTSRDFSAYTRSKIEHTRYDSNKGGGGGGADLSPTSIGDQRSDSNSLPFMDSG